MSRWKFFLGAAILAIAVLGPLAPMPDVLGGIALAAVLHWKLALGGNKSETPRDK